MLNNVWDSGPRRFGNLVRQWYHKEEWVKLISEFSTIITSKPEQVVENHKQQYLDRFLFSIIYIIFIILLFIFSISEYWPK